MHERLKTMFSPLAFIHAIMMSCYTTYIKKVYSVITVRGYLWQNIGYINRNVEAFFFSLASSPASHYYALWDLISFSKHIGNNLSIIFFYTACVCVYEKKE